MPDKKNLHRANKLTLLYFLKMLKKSETAQKYIKERKITDVSKEFFVGYADKSNNLVKFLHKNKVSTADALHLGLIGENEDSFYSVFRNRIMFPIINNKKIIGFAGRVLDGGKNKYLNSKASNLYDKGKVLYVLDKAKKEIHKRKWALVVEGYTDVITLHKFGIKNVVAVCGTAFKDTHARMLKRWCSTVFTCFDGDKPGQKAADKTEVSLKRNSMKCKNIVLPDELDPDEYLNTYGREALIDLLKNA